jgi:hypothetical protein
MYTAPKKKYRMEDKLRSETKISEKNTKIQKQIEETKQAIYSIFKKNQVDYYIKIRAINIIRKELQDEKYKGENDG